MSPEKKEILLQKYPKLLDGLREIECADGWFNLLDCLCSNIQHYLEYNVKSEEKNKCRVLQIKEKFGGLRFYVYGADDVIRGMISFAESMSHKLCELCGNSDSDTENFRGWIRTLCNSCKDKR